MQVRLVNFRGASLCEFLTCGCSPVCAGAPLKLDLRKPLWQIHLWISLLQVTNQLHLCQSLVTFTCTSLPVQANLCTLTCASTPIFFTKHPCPQRYGFQPPCFLAKGYSTASPQAQIPTSQPQTPTHIRVHGASNHQIPMHMTIARQTHN